MNNLTTGKYDIPEVEVIESGQRDFDENDKPDWLPLWYTKSDPDMYTKGVAIEVFAKTFLKAVRGVRTGEPVEFQQWQRWLFNNLMECDEKGSLRYSNCLIMIPRKNGKTFLMGILLAYHLINAPDYAELYSAASTRDQAKLVFNLVKAWIETNPTLQSMFLVQSHENTITNKITKSVYKALSADANTSHGTAPYFLIADEIHTWDGESAKSRDRAREQYNSYIKGSADQHSSQIVSISTAGNNVNDSLLGDLYKRGVAEAKSEGYGSFGFWCWQADEADDPLELSTWLKANPSLREGILLPDKMTEQLEMSTYIGFNTFLRDALNVWVDLAGDPYIQPILWKKAKLSTPSVFGTRGRKVTVGFDASKRGDSTAIVVSDIETGEVGVWKLWERPENAPDDWLISRDEVTASMREVVEFYDVKAIWCDSFYYESEIDSWIKKFKWKNVVKVSQSGERKNKMAIEFRKDLYEGDAVHADDESMNRHISNVVQTANDSFRKPSDRRKIDIFIAAILANGARNMYLNDGNKPKKRRAMKVVG